VLKPAWLRPPATSISTALVASSAAYDQHAVELRARVLGRGGVAGAAREPRKRVALDLKPGLGLELGNARELAGRLGREA